MLGILCGLGLVIAAGLWAILSGTPRTDPSNCPFGAGKGCDGPCDEEPPCVK